MDVLYRQWKLSNMDTRGTKICVLISEVSLFQGENMYLYKVGTWSSVLINQVSLFQRCPLREVPLYFFDQTLQLLSEGSVYFLG